MPRTAKESYERLLKTLNNSSPQPSSQVTGPATTNHVDNQTICFGQLSPQAFKSLGKKKSAQLLKTELSKRNPVEKLKLLLNVANNNAYLCLIKSSNGYLINDLFKIQFRKLFHNTHTPESLISFCKSFTELERIKLLERMVSFQENQRLRMLSLQALHLELINLEDKLKNFNGVSINQLASVAETAMNILTIDICNKEDELLKEKLLITVNKAIDLYFNKKANQTPKKISQILEILSRNNSKLYYDAHWQLEQKREIFGSLAKKLLSIVNDLLDKNCQFTWNDFANIFATFTSSPQTGTFKPPSEAFTARILQRMEELWLRNKTITPKQAFQILDQLQSLKAFNPTSTQKQTLFKLIEKAMPLLKQAALGPFRMFDNYIFNAQHRAFFLLQLFPQRTMDPNRFFTLLDAKVREKGNIKFSSIEIDRLMTLSTPNADHKLFELSAQLHSISQFRISAITEDNFLSDDESSSDVKRSQTKSYNTRSTDGKFHWQLDPLLKYIELMRSDNNPKGLNHLLKSFSGQISYALSKANVTYYADDIVNYLKPLRSLVIDITDPTVQMSIYQLCLEAVKETTIDKLTPGIALDLLWINMVLSINSKNQDISYTPLQQQALFEKICNLKINPTQARQLFEIRTMGWHGNISFVCHTELTDQMDKYFNTTFKTQGSKTYKFEQFCYDEITKQLHDTNIKLQLNTTCAQSVREIDISYEQNGIKVAINVDGSPHFDPATNQQNMNTTFRNTLLKRAGWNVFDINLIELDALTDPDKCIAACKDIAGEIKKLFAIQRPSIFSLFSNLLEWNWCKITLANETPKTYSTQR